MNHVTTRLREVTINSIHHLLSDQRDPASLKAAEEVVSFGFASLDWTFIAPDGTHTRFEFDSRLGK